MPFVVNHKLPQLMHLRNSTICTDHAFRDNGRCPGESVWTLNHDGRSVGVVVARVPTHDAERVAIQRHDVSESVVAIKQHQLLVLLLIIQT